MMKKFIIFTLFLLSCSVIYAGESNRTKKKNNKTKVSQPEVVRPVNFVDRMMTLDKDRDGKLSRKELESFRPSMMGPKPPLKPIFPKISPQSPVPWQMPPPMNFPYHWQRHK